ncbi:MAG: PAS domain-containing sensor histidine kinase [Alphaproteobacteria bacterium]|nr:PAS domain-containing sensor histidine kinase [Alphaproteobacteria bacterium]
MATSDPDVYRTIFDISAIGMFQSTPQGRFLAVNAAFARILGFDSAADLLAGTVDLARQYYGNPAQRAEITARLARDGRVEGMLVEARRRDGASFWCSLSAAALRDPAGNVTSFVGTIVDVTDLVDAREKLRAAADEMRRIFDNASEGMYRSSPDGRQIRANPALVRLNGYDSEAELLAGVNDIGREWYVDPDRRGEFRRLLERDGHLTNFESEVFRHKTRERIWISENAWIVRDAAGKPVFYEGTVVDITQRKLAEQALRHNEERFRDYAETASDWFWETGPDHRFTYMSPKTSSSPARPDPRLGMTRREIAVGAEHEPERWLEHQATLDRREPFRDFVYRGIRNSGQLAYVSASGKPIFDGAGNFLGYRGSARDVTATVVAAEQLQGAMAEAGAASNAKIAFLANMSHELRTPLNAILGFADMIRSQIFGANDPRYATYARFICDSGKHLLNLVNDVLDMAKIDAGRLELLSGDVDLGDMVAQQAALMAPRAKEGGVALEIAAGPTLIVRADEQRLRQIVLNLLSNAIKFTPAGGTVTLSVGISDDGRASIAVADTGIGMDADEVELALQPFRQVESHLDRTREGTGLGLPITKSLVELHGGELNIESAKGKGTTVTVLLPAASVVGTSARTPAARAASGTAADAS